MTMEISRLHGTTSADLLAIPVIMLGFHPRESCVVLGIRGSRVEFCARMDLEWFTNDFHFGEVADQLHNAISRCLECRVAVLAYTSDRDAGAIAVSELIAVVGEETVMEALITDGDRFWYAHPGILLPPEGIPYSYASSSFAAQAVYSGVSVNASRQDAVAEVQPVSKEELVGVQARIDAAWDKISRLGPHDRQMLLAQHLEETQPLESAGPEIVVLLQGEELYGEVLSQLNRGSANRLRAHLARARRLSPDSLAANVVSLLTLACWLDGEGAQQSECLSQLESMDPGHPLLRVLQAMHKGAVPPILWDE